MEIFVEWLGKCHGRRAEELWSCFLGEYCERPLWKRCSRTCRSLGWCFAFVDFSEVRHYPIPLASSSSSSSSSSGSSLSTGSGSSSIVGISLSQTHEEEVSLEEDKYSLRQDRYPLRTSPQFLGPQIEDILSALAAVTQECNSSKSFSKSSTFY